MVGAGGMGHDYARVSTGEQTPALPRDLFETDPTQTWKLAPSAGWDFTDRGDVKTGRFKNTNIPGLVAAEAIKSRAPPWIINRSALEGLPCA